MRAMSPVATTYSVLPVRLLLQSARACGLDDAALLNAAGVQPALLDDVDARVPAEAVEALWDDVARRSGDPAFGLHIAEQSPRGSFGVVEYVCRNAATLGQALRTMTRYARLVHDGALLDLEVDDREARLLLRSVDLRGGSPSLVEWTLTYVLLAAREMTGTELAPETAVFRHPTRGAAAEWARVYRCPVTFGGPYHALVFAPATLDLPVRRADPALARLLAVHAEERLARLPQPEGFGGRLRWAIRELLPNGAPRLPDVARLLATSPRSLQRRLQEEGTSFQALVTEVRNETAAHYLTERDHGIGEIAFLLGFSEPSAFHRAFKRWSGRTPSEYRQHKAS